MVKVLFVCLGNICRSPMAEGIFMKLLEEDGLHQQISCDSAGTNSYHIGDLADARMRKTARSKGIELSHRARAFVAADLDLFDYILVMDLQNKAAVEKKIKGKSSLKASIHMMRDFDPLEPGAEVPDPWYGDEQGFEECYHILQRSCVQLLQAIRKEQAL